MSSNPTTLLAVEPKDLEFEFELNKQISCMMNLLNRSDDFVAFKVKTTNPKKYCVRPNIGIVPPYSSFEVLVTMQAQQEAPPDLQCKDKFLLQSGVASQGATVKDITPDMFVKDTGRRVEETRLKVVYVPPAQKPAPIIEEDEGAMSPAVSVADNGSYDLTESKSVSRPPVVSQNDLLEASTQQIAKLSKNKQSIFQQNNNLRHEMDQLRRSAVGRGGFSFVFVVIVGLLGMLMGYILKKN